MAKYQVINMLAVSNKKTQQTGDIAGCPIARNKTFRKTYVARFHRLRKRLPVVQMQTGVQLVTMGLAKLRDLAFRPMHCQYAMLQLLK